MENSKKTISCKKQFCIGLVPYIGFFIVFLVGYYGIHKRKKNWLYSIIYYFLCLVPVAFFFAVAYIVIYYAILGNNINLVITLSLVISYIMCVCCAVAFVFIFKAMIDKFEKDERKKIENNLS